MNENAEPDLKDLSVLERIKIISEDIKSGADIYLGPHFPSSVDIQCGEKAILL